MAIIIIIIRVCKVFLRIIFIDAQREFLDV